MADINLKKKEAKTVTLTIKDKDGNTVDVSTATLTFVIKKNIWDTSALVTKEDADFDKSQAANGIVSFVLTTTDTDQTSGKYVGELKTYFNATNIDKSATINIIIADAVTD